MKKCKSNGIFADAIDGFIDLDWSEKLAIYGMALELAPREVQSNKKFVCAAVNDCGQALAFACQELRSDKAVVRRAVRQDGAAIRYASDTVKSDRRTAIVAIGNDGYALKTLSSHFGRDEKLVMLSVTGRGGHADYFEYAHDDLKKDKAYVLSVLQKCKEGRERKTVVSYSSDEIQQLCKGKDPIQSLERAIAYESMQSTLAKKQEPREQKRGLKI